MRKHYDFLFEVARFPVIVLLIGVIILGLGNILINPNAAMLWNHTNQYVLLVSAMMRMMGGVLILLFPLGFLLALLSTHFEDFLASVIGVVAYLVIHVTTMFFASDKLPADAYASTLGIGLEALQSVLLTGQVRLPLQMGLIASFASYYVTKISYVKTRSKKTYGLFSFIDKNSMALLFALVLSVGVGLMLSYLWPFVIQLVYMIFRFIAEDITNPFNLFLYGAMEKLLSAVNLERLLRHSFWFTEYGGSWLDAMSRKFAGDIAIWTAQLASSKAAIGIGRFVTPLYVIHLFAIPGYLAALFSLVSNRFEKRKYFALLLIAITVSMLAGNSLPFDLLMLVTSPLLFLLHVFTSGILYALFEWAKVYIGFSYSGTVLYASAGTLQDLLMYARSQTMLANVSMLVVAGLAVFFLYFVLTRTYYKYLAIDVFQSGRERMLTDQLVAALGGLDNIRLIDYNIMKILVQVKNDQLVDVMQLRKLCHSKVFESKTGFVLYFYKASPKLGISIKQRILKLSQNSH